MPQGGIGVCIKKAENSNSVLIKQRVIQKVYMDKLQI